MGLVHLTGQSKGFKKAEEGAVLVITAFTFIALLGIAALVVDIVTIHQAKLRAQATADASVLAAALDITDLIAATDAGKEYALRNYDVLDGDWAGCVDAAPLAVATTVPCMSVDDADDPTLIRIRIPDRRVPSFFASVLGRNGFDVSASAIAEVELVVISPGTSGPGPGVDPNAPSVRDGDTAGWLDTETEEGCPANFWEDHPAEDTGRQWREYIFVFEHINGDIVVWCDTNRNDKYVGQTGIYGNDIGKCCKERCCPEARLPHRIRAWPWPTCRARQAGMMVGRRGTTPMPSTTPSGEWCSIASTGAPVTARRSAWTTRSVRATTSGL